MEQAIDVVKKYCDQCGVICRGEARFCSNCGADVAALSQQAGQSPGSPDLSAEESPDIDGHSPMGLGMAWLIYFVAIVLWLGVVLLPNGHMTAILALIVHFGFGFLMTRYVMRGLIEFHPVHNTLANVFFVKLWMFLLWPLRMPVLLFQLTVNGAL